jgi:hypothetical protein
MTRLRWKDTLESVGIIAIIASLIFVGIETRNSTQQAKLTTQALEITAYQELMTNIEEMNTLTMHSDAAAATMAKIWIEPGDIESFRVTRAIFLLLRHGDMAFYMFERGAIDESRLRSAISPITLSNPLVRNQWEMYKLSFAEEYRGYIDKLIADLDGDLESGPIN